MTTNNNFPYPYDKTYSIIGNTLYDNTMNNTSLNYIFTTDNTTSILTNNNLTNNTNCTFPGDVVIDGDLTVGKHNITKALEKIYERLELLDFNHRLEDKWEKLKELGDQYRALEKELLKKEELWNKIKS